MRQRFLSLKGSRSKVWEYFGLPARDDQALGSNDGGSSSNSSNSHGSTSIPSGQQRLPELLQQQERSSKLTESFCYFLAKDSQPFDTVNGAGF